VNLFDSSALLCFLESENGADTVERELTHGGVCSAANWSEVAQKIHSRGRDWGLVSGLLLSYGLVIEPVNRDDAEAAARLWKRGSELSLADRVCIATGRRLDAVVWTADTAWGHASPIRQVRDPR
jgi:PIN domain nuclease of toxin-antitoxin system